MRWNWEVLDEFVGTNISSFTDASIPELAPDLPESKYWNSNFFLNSVFRGKFARDGQRLVHLFLRRLAIAVEEYDLARDQTLNFIDGRAAGDTPIGHYFSALHHWEDCLGATWQAIEAWRWLAAPNGAEKPMRVFEPGDSSREERLHGLHSWSKHSETRPASEMPEIGPLPIWLDTEGLRSNRHVLAWDELKTLLVELGAVADLVQDPRSVSEARDAKDNPC